MGGGSDRWYYYWCADGKQYQKACKSCRTRAEAEDYVRSLDPPLGVATMEAARSKVLIRDIAREVNSWGAGTLKYRVITGVR
jgi:hypothetical protein